MPGSGWSWRRRPNWLGPPGIGGLLGKVGLESGVGLQVGTHMVLEAPEVGHELVSVHVSDGGVVVLGLEQGGEHAQEECKFGFLPCHDLVHCTV